MKLKNLKKNLLNIIIVIWYWCSNGTDALTLSLRSIKIADNDEITTVANTAAATISAIVQSGKTYLC